MPHRRLSVYVPLPKLKSHDAGAGKCMAMGSMMLMVQGKVYEGPLVDIWSIGVMLFACLTGTLPFSADESDLKALLRQIILHDPEIPASVPSDARNLLKGMLQKDPQRRIQVCPNTTSVGEQHVRHVL